MMRKFVAGMGLLCIALAARAQTGFPVNGAVTPAEKGAYAITNATIVQNGKSTLTNATLVVRDGKIVAVGKNVTIPRDALVVDGKGKFLYPSFIDIYSDYGMPRPERATSSNPMDFFRRPAQLETNVKGPFGWNQALRTEVEAVNLFSPDKDAAGKLREAGFGTVVTHQQDGIARGTGAVAMLSEEPANAVFIKPRAAAFYSLNKGTSTQSYPGSLMGSIALLRQTYLDANWYKDANPANEINLTLRNWNDVQSLPQIMDAEFRGADLWNVMRTDRIGDEFGVQYIIKSSGKEYQRIKDVAATKAPLIVSLNFPQAQDVEDPNAARYVALSDLKHWEMAPTNPAAIAGAGIPFVLTMTDSRDARTFWTSLRKAIQYGLTEAQALEALTNRPATLLGIYDKVGSLETGKLANFLITTGNLFDEKTQIVENWVNGLSYPVNPEVWKKEQGKYNLAVNFPNNRTENLTVLVRDNSSATILKGSDTLTGNFSLKNQMVSLAYAPAKAAARRGAAPARGSALPANAIRLSGVSNNQQWSGTGLDSLGNTLTWTATYTGELEQTSSASARRDSLNRNDKAPETGNVVFPFLAYGFKEGQGPKQETLLVRNATVWTSEEANPVLTETDVLVRNGKIAGIGKNLSASGARVIDGTGKYLTAGIIDEHSHIATASVNEGGQSVTSEVRIGDNINPDDINIYRQLSGGVTTSHILHGSANTIGGQTQLIKLRWGANDEEMKFAGAPGFIKFALGENVKRTSMSSGNTRFPDTRMGVEQVMVDAFTRARDYESQMKAYEDGRRRGARVTPVRRDLELDALVEIMNNERFITCHSYVASEILNTMQVAEQFGFKVNTFTHILEGYKVAEEMKKHGANASTFSDWWAYKLEVQDAIPYNAKIMNDVGLTVAINSDDAEMARRLNQEAAKSVKYGGMSEQEAWKMVTINPAKMLHVDQKVGSIAVGKDADLVLWSDNPLSIYAKSLYTVVDGIVYFDREKDLELRKDIQAERTRLIQKMLGEKSSGRPVSPATPTLYMVHTCGDSDHHHDRGMFEVENTFELEQFQTQAEQHQH